MHTEYTSYLHVFTMAWAIINHFSLFHSDARTCLFRGMRLLWRELHNCLQFHYVYAKLWIKIERNKKVKRNDRAEQSGKSFCSTFARAHRWMMRPKHQWKRERERKKDERENEIDFRCCCCEWVFGVIFKEIILQALYGSLAIIL